MWFFNKKKTREEIVKDEILRFKKRVEKRFGFTGREGLGPFVKPCVSWYKSEADGIEWNDVHVLLFFSSDKSDMGITIKIESQTNLKVGLFFIVIKMVEYITLLNALKDKIQEEVFETARKLNHKLTDEDIVKFVKIILVCISERGFAYKIDYPLATEMEEYITQWI